MEKFFKTISILFLFCSITFLSHQTIIKAYSEENIFIPIDIDTYVEEGFPTVSPWNNRNLYLGNDIFYNKQRAEIYVSPLASVFNNLQINPNQIKHASLHIWAYQGTVSDTMPIIIKIPSSNWDQENLNYLNKPSDLPEIQQTATLSNNLDEKTIDITELIKYSITHNILSRGFHIITNSENKELVFWSTVCATAPTDPRCTTNQIPYIQILYINNSPPPQPTNLQPANKKLDTHNISLTWNKVVDPDGDNILYGVNIKQNNALIKQFHDLTVNRKNIILPKDGEYTWEVIATDGHLTSRSNPRTFTIDTTPPPVPILEPIPPYLNIPKYTLKWSIDNTTHYSVIQIDNNINFTNPTQLHTDKNTWETPLLNNSSYFFRIKNCDDLNNCSTWSAVISTTIDTIPPLAQVININHQYISHKKPLLHIRTNLIDKNIQTWTLKITKESGQTIFQKTGDSKQIDITWKHAKEDDGRYYIIFEAKDKADNLFRAKPILFYIDNTPPIQPQIDMTSAMTNIKIQTIKFKFGDENINKIYLNDKLVLTTTNKNSTLRLPLKEGKNIIKAESLDKAENKSSNAKTIILDTTPPHTPLFRLYLDKNKRQIIFQPQTYDWNKLYIYNVAGLHTTTYKHYPLILVNNYADNTTYSFAAVACDKLNNCTKLTPYKRIKTPNIGIGKGTEAQYKYPQATAKGFCYIKYNKTYNRTDAKYCSLSAPDLNYVLNSQISPQEYYIEVKGSYNSTINFKISTYECKPKKWWNPRTWYQCIPTNKKNIYKEENFLTGIRVLINNKPEKDFISSQAHRNRFDHIIKTPNNEQGDSISIYYILGGSIYINNHPIQILEISPHSNTLKIGNAIKANFNSQHKYLRFPFKRIIGVTQWHGYTAYEHPHTGIDFGAFKEPILATANGYIASVGWDSYFGKCLSGGYYIKIAHDNGFYTVYMHLENIKNPHTNRTWRVGERVLRGEKIATSGNSGAYNCQPLGYHLHYEVRKNRWQSSHIDPVPVTDINWNAIPTLGVKQYPGRLTGDNPHPNY